MCSLHLCDTMWICGNVFLQFFEELATESNPEKANEVDVKDTRGKQVIFTESRTSVEQDD